MLPVYLVMTIGISFVVECLVVQLYFLVLNLSLAVTHNTLCKLFPLEILSMVQIVESDS